MKLRSATNGPISTSCTSIRKPYRTTVLIVEELAFLYKLKVKVPEQIYCYIEKYYSFFTNEIQPLYLEYIITDKEQIEGKQHTSLASSNEQEFLREISKSEVNISAMSKEAIRTMIAYFKIIEKQEYSFSKISEENILILEYYRKSIISWVKLLTGEEIIIDDEIKPLTLTQELIDTCRTFETEAIENFMATAKTDKLKKFSTTKAGFCFWLIIYRIFKHCGYKTDKGKSINSKYFCKLVKKGISHNTLDIWNSSYSQHSAGAPGEIQVGSNREFINLDMFYYDLFNIIINKGK